MKKNTRPTTAAEKKGGSDASPYYQLHTQAVEDLVSATSENTPKYSKEELEKYRSGKTSKFRLPEWLKVLLIKFWFYGAICFFVFWGLGLYVADQLDLYFVAAIIMGMVNDLLVKHFLRFTEKLPGGSARWMMVTKDGVTGFFLNLLYAFPVLFVVVTVYSLINMGLAAVSTGGDPLFLGVEPLLFGLFTMGADQLFIFLKQVLLSIFRDAKAK